MVNVLPLPGSLSTEIEPPCPSTMRFTSARPMPTPPSAGSAGVRTAHELLEDARALTWRDADAAVTDADLDRCARTTSEDPYRGVGLRVLHGVVEQVGEGPGQGLGVGSDERQVRLDLTNDGPRPGLRLSQELADDVLDQLVEPDRLQAPRIGPSLDAAKGQQALDHAVQPLGFVRQEPVVVGAAFLARHAAGCEQIGQVTHGRERRAELVRHRGDKVRLLARERELA